MTGAFIWKLLVDMVGELPLPFFFDEESVGKDELVDAAFSSCEGNLNSK